MNEAQFGEGDGYIDGWWQDLGNSLGQIPEAKPRYLPEDEESLPGMNAGAEADIERAREFS